ncbi:MAG: cytochrome c family protein [Ignavibacteriae bacterium]|nr:cytochrome c family protein [Ignavibacteriota bacterium]
MGQAENKYVGVKACAMCHKTEKQGNQLAIWQKSKHAEAYKSLTTVKADSIAKARGLTKSASESPECLKCHVIGYDGSADLLDKNYDYKDGVQCETCHGAGSGYKTLAIMKDKAKSVAAGLQLYKDDAEIEKFCVTCHNDKSPMYKGFKIKEMWGKIKHPKPKT